MSKFQSYGAEAEKMFVERGLSCAEIAKILPISEQTLSAWRSKYKWDEKRLRFLKSDETVIERFRQALSGKLQLLTDALERGEDITARDVDAITKLLVSLERLERGVNIIGAAPVVMKELVNFLKKNEKEELAMALGDAIPEFMAEIWERYKK